MNNVASPTPTNITAHIGIKISPVVGTKILIKASAANTLLMKVKNAKNMTW
jgi:hypothetical protein